MNKYAAAGKELLNGNIGNAIKIATINTKSYESELIQPSTYRNGNFFFGVNGADKAFIWGGFNSSLKAYQDCPVVTNIINRKAQCSINGVLSIVDDNNKVSDLDYAKKCVKLMKKPNRIQTGKQFIAQGKVYQQIYGYCPVLVIKPSGFEQDPSTWQLWNLPPWMLLMQNNTKMFYDSEAMPFDSITLSYMGNTANLPLDAVFFIKENTISSGTYQSNSSSPNVSLQLPDSKLNSLQENINNLMGSFQSRGSLIVNRGPMWILSNDSNDSSDAGLFPIDPDAKKQVQQDFLQYGTLAKQKKAIITDAKLKLQTVGFDAAQLQLLPGELQDAKIICDTLNYPAELLALIDSKYDNQDIAERSLYTNSIMPDMDSDMEQWSYLLGLEKFSLRLISNFKHLPALQENLESRGKGMFFMNQAAQIGFLNNMLTWNEWRDKIDMPLAAGMDKYYFELLKEGYVFGSVPNVAVDSTGTTQVKN